MILLIAEKPSVASMIANNYGNCVERKGEKSIPVYTFTQMFEGSRTDFVCTSVAGHVFELDFDKEFNKASTPHERLFEEGHTTYSLTSSGASVKQLLNSLGRQARQLILCLDNDREGENICFEILSILESSLHPNCLIRRARFSAVTATEIRRAFQHLDKPNKNFSDAVKARQELDLKIGVAFTRFQTTYLHGQFANLKSSVISFGPCQTPTLAFCVARHDEIQAFRPKQIYSLDVHVNIKGHDCQLKWQGKPTENRGEVEAKLKQLSERNSSKALKILSFKTTKRTLACPMPMNTVAMLKAASNLLGLPPNETMIHAERLYISGYISYPRTESTSYPSSYNLKDIVSKLTGAQSSKVAEHASKLIASTNSGSGGYTKPHRGVDKGDHPPIMPTDYVPQSLHGIELSLYNLISKHFLATVSPAAVFNHNTLTLQSVDLPSETFLLSITDMVEPGWRALYTHTEFRDFQDEDGINDREDSDLEDTVVLLNSDTLRSISKVGSELIISSSELRARTTKAPSYLSESDLLGLMEKNGIGTDATMAIHIGNIVTREYVELRLIGRRRCLVPTSMGISLIHGYQLIDEELSSPQLRASIENDVTKIADGKISKNTLVSRVLAKFLDKFLNFRKNISRLEALLEAKFTSVKDAGKPFIFCGSCNRYTNLIEQYPPRVYCKICDMLYTIPLRGKLIAIVSQKCPYDNWQLVMHVSESTQKRTFICLHCYTFGLSRENTQRHIKIADAANKSFDIEQTRGLTCNTCLNDECKMSLFKTSLGSCWNCNNCDSNAPFSQLVKACVNIGPEPAVKSDTPVEINLQEAEEKPKRAGIHLKIDPNQSKKDSQQTHPVINIQIAIPKATESKATPAAHEKANKQVSVAGYLYTDLGSTQRYPEICCNSCNLRILFKVHKIKILPDCCACGRLQLSVNKTSQSGEEGETIKGCIHCNTDAFGDVAEYQLSSEKRTWNSRQPHKGHHSGGNKHGRHH